MTNSHQRAAAGKNAPPRLLSLTSRAVVAAGVVFATATSVWVADAVSSSPPPGMASASQDPGPRLAGALPTVTIVGRRASLEPTPERVLPDGASEMSSLAAADLPSGRVKFRQ